jgi:hypothetical protein
VAQDRTVEQWEPREVDKPPEAQSPQADLAARLERLPVGHPSSPYRDDNSRKPPPLDLSKYELPLPDESDSLADDRADQTSDVAWDHKGRQLTPEASRAADLGLAYFRDMEGRDAEGNYGDHGLTPTMRRIEANLDHGKLVADTEKFALKDPDRFKEKLADRIALQPDEKVADLISRIHDGIRYTFEYDDEHYTEGVYDTEACIETHGYELTVRKPSWDGDEYKGINSQWRDSNSGVLFEIQFHTHASWEARQKTHMAYEKLADPETSPEESDELRAFQRRVAGSVPIPLGALDIPHYCKEGS